MATVTQTSYNPTNKLSAAIVAGAVVAIARALISSYLPAFDDESVWIAVTPLVIWGCGYFVKDEATVIVTPETPK
jgi:uncharacterized membrane protein